MEFHVKETKTGGTSNQEKSKVFLLNLMNSISPVFVPTWKLPMYWHKAKRWLSKKTRELQSDSHILHRQSCFWHLVVQTCLSVWKLGKPRTESQILKFSLLLVGLGCFSRRSQRPLNMFFRQFFIRIQAKGKGLKERRWKNGRTWFSLGKEIRSHRK